MVFNQHIYMPTSSPANPHICTPVTQMPHIYTPIPPDVPSDPIPKHLSQNQTLPSTLHPHVSATQHFIHWMTPFGLTKIAELNTHLPPLIITCQRVVLGKAVNAKTPSNYSAGLLQFTQFCDNMGILKELRMPAPEWLLSHFITTKGAGSVGAGAMKTLLLGLELWHVINFVPWHGAAHLKWAAQGAQTCTP